MTFYCCEGELYCEECAFLHLEELCESYGRDLDEEREHIESTACISDSSDSVAMCGHCGRIWRECDLTEEGFIPSLRSFVEGLLPRSKPLAYGVNEWKPPSRNTLLKDSFLSHYVGKGVYEETDTIRVWDYEHWDYLMTQVRNSWALGEPESEILYRIGQCLEDEETCEGERIENLCKALLLLLPQEAN